MPIDLINSRERSRRHLAIALVSALALAGCAGESVGAATDSTSSTVVADNTSAFLDESVIHDISVEFDQTEYEAMVDEYRDSGEKGWITTTVTIDGSVYENAGIRLKGNSSLRGLAGDRGAGADGASSATPEDLPWLIRLDTWVDGQSHEGVTDFVIRSNITATALNEAVALDLLDAAGLASQDQAYAAFTVNGSDAVLRLVVENPDDIWLDTTLSRDGILYKSEATGDYSYRGDDPESYDEVFDIEAGEDNGDLTPLIEFLDFINNSDDETLAAELPERLDIEAFANYLAMEDLIDNFDDIDGPGNNSYLFYDVDTGVFTVVPWDHNLAFNAMNGAGPNGLRDGTTDGDVRPDRPDGAGNDGFGPQPDTADDGGARPQPGTGLQPGTEGMAQPGNDLGGRGPGGGSNVLVERFLAVDEWQDLYDTSTERLQSEIFDSGVAAETLSKWTALLENGASQLVDSGTISSEATAVQSSFS